MSNNSKLLNQVKHYHIAYFDILGYRNVFDDPENDIIEFLQNVIAICDETKDSTLEKSRLLNTDFIVKSFSDNFMILVETPSGASDYNILKFFVHILSRLQIQFLAKHKILIRGGVTKGEAYIDDNIVFGSGLLRAVELEEHYAVFPRIILDKNCFDQHTISELQKYYSVSKDDDDMFYIDYFKELFWLNGDDQQTSYEGIRSSIATLVRKNGKYHRQLKDDKKIAIAEKVISKHAWVLTKFNEACRKNGKEPILYTLTLYNRLMKAEIQIQ